MDFLELVKHRLRQRMSPEDKRKEELWKKVSSKKSPEMLKLALCMYASTEEGHKQLQVLDIVTKELSRSAAVCLAARNRLGGTDAKSPDNYRGSKKNR